MVQLLWETAWQLLKRLNIESPRDPATQLLAVDPKGKENLSTQNLYTDVLKSIVLIAKRWKQPRCLSSTDEWINNMWYIHTMVYSLAIKEMK